MKKLLPHFENVTTWQYVLLAILSVSVTWMTTTYAVIQYINNAGSDISSLGGLPRVALTTFDITVIFFGLGVFVVSGVACLMLLSIWKRLRAYPAIQIIWGSFILLGVFLAYAFR